MATPLFSLFPPLRIILIMLKRVKRPGMSFHLRPLTAFNLSPAALLSIAERLQCVLRREEGEQLQIPALSTFWLHCLKRFSHGGKFGCCPAGHQAQDVNTVLRSVSVLSQFRSCEV